MSCSAINQDSLSSLKPAREEIAATGPGDGGSGEGPTGKEMIRWLQGDGTSQGLTSDSKKR